MTEGKKALEFKHAHITGQAMRDHWGPIIDRIADETADWRDARIEALEARVAELEDVAGDLLTRFEPWSPHDHDAAKRARAALGEKQ